MAAELDDHSLIDDILREAERKSLSQKALAARAELSEEALSRMKKRGSARLSAVLRLARAAGVRVVVLPEESRSSAGSVAPARFAATDQPKRFRDRHPELVWSNRGADDAVYIQRALLDPRFTTLLDAAQEFGVDRLEREWDVLAASPSKEARRAWPTTSRILRNIRRGYEQASR
jgi:DNA-binding phage protein